MPLTTDDINVTPKVEVGDYSDRAFCPICGREIFYDYDAEEWEPHTLTECLKDITAGKAGKI